MEKYENGGVPPSSEYDTYTAEYISALFTLFHPLQSYRYPTTNPSSSYIPTWKSQVTQSEPSLQARQNAVRNLFNFHQVYAQSFSPFMSEVSRNLPRHRRLGRSCNHAHQRRLHSRTPDYLELNRRRPSVIRRSIKSGSGKCSSPRVAILEPNYESGDEMKTGREITPVIPNYPPSEASVIHKDLQLSKNYPQIASKDRKIISPSTPNYPQSEANFFQKDPQLSIKDRQIIHKDPQSGHIISHITPKNQNSLMHNRPQPEHSPTIHKRTPFIPKYPESDHLISRITTKHPFESNSLQSEDSQKSPIHPKKQGNPPPSPDTRCHRSQLHHKADLDASFDKVREHTAIHGDPHSDFTRSRTTRISFKNSNKKQSNSPVNHAIPNVSIDTYTHKSPENANNSRTSPNYPNRTFDVCLEQSNSNVIQYFSMDTNPISQTENAKDITRKSNHENPIQSNEVSNTVSVEQSDLTSSNDSKDTKISSKNTNTAKPDHTNLTETGNFQSTKKDKKFKFGCFHCKKRFRWFSHWQAHERIHTGFRPYKCTQCDRCFTRGDGLQAHMAIHNTKKAHKCTSCSKVFGRKSMLERHIVEHTGIIPYKCEVCEVEVLDPERIIHHLDKHKEQTRFACQYCKRCFLNGRTLVRHIRAHTGEKAFPCSQCKMRFSKKSALLIHHRVHSGVKPFCCPDCGKAFSIVGNLRRHLLIHTGERPYPCTKCKKKFNNKSHLARHVSSQH